ncbi:MAG: T9SS type A sorting domain-containing protein [Bacteroidetes bacterium]|nr:T9SS type A sorting domain-containing protein [Bacteroidota bacterium]
MKHFTLLFLLFVSIQSVFSQTDKKAGTSYSQIIEAPAPDPVITEIVKNIDIARDNNDVVSKLYWEGKLNEITKPQIIKETTGVFNFKRGEENQGASQIINLSTITGNKIVANAISRERVHGDIYAAVGVYGTNTLPDTLKIFRSSDNGITFNLLLKYTNPSLAIHNNSIDIEAVSNGDSSYAFVTMTYTSTGTSNSAILRVRQDGHMESGIILLSNATKKYTNIRITSDNARFTTTTYIYISATLDSTGGGTRRLKSKLLRVLNPFSSGLSVTSSYQQPVTGQYGYGFSGAVPDSAKFETDIAYVSSTESASTLCTVTIASGVPNEFNNGRSLYFTKDANLGAFAPILFFATTPVSLKESPRFAATGYMDNSAVVISRSLFDGNDWDPLYAYTQDITIGAPVFDYGYVQPSASITMGVSVAANYRAKGSYLFAFSEKFDQISGNIYIRPFKGGQLGAQSTMVMVNNIAATTTLGLPDVGFRNVNDDSCLVIWSGSQGMGSYVSGGCSGPVIGIHPSNTLAERYHLSQNYPNPFNPTTNINYEIPAREFVTLKIYDVLGMEVMELVNEIQQAGNHSATFDAKSLPSGTYFYKLSTDKFSDVKKMVVVK